MLAPVTASTAHRSSLMCTVSGNHLCVAIPGPLTNGEDIKFDILGNGRNLYWDVAGTDPATGYPQGYVQTSDGHFLQGQGGGNPVDLVDHTSGVSGVVWIWPGDHLVNRAASNGTLNCVLGSDNHNGDRARIQDWGTAPCSGGSSGWYTALNWPGAP